MHYFMHYFMHVCMAPSLQKRRADEVQTLRAGIMREQEKSGRLYMWVQAMKTEIHEYEALLKDR
jgi:hypothetical protein